MCWFSIKNYSLTDMFSACVVPRTWFMLRWCWVHHAAIRSCSVKCLSDLTGSSAVRRRDVNVSVSSLPVVGALPSMFGGLLCLLILHLRSYVLMLLLVLCCTQLSDHRTLTILAICGPCRTSCRWDKVSSFIHSYTTRLEWHYHSKNRFRSTVQLHSEP